MASRASDELSRRLSRLACVASGCTSPEGLVSAASHELGRRLVLLDLTGKPMAYAGPATGAEPELAALRAAISSAAEPPLGWRLVSIESGSELLAFLAVSPVDTSRPEECALLDLVVSMLGDKLRGATLTNAVRAERQAALTRRLVTDHAITPAGLRGAARAAGMRLADFYLPALLVWTSGHPGPRTLAEVDAEAQRRAAGSITAPLDGATIVVLFPDRVSGTIGHRPPQRLVGDLVSHIRRLGHRNVRGITGEASVRLATLAAGVGELLRLRHYLSQLAGDRLVLPAQSFALDRLLSESLDRQPALAFLDGTIGGLLRHDADRGSDLAHILELALDFPRRDDAAHAGYMHRNTFRRRLNHALELVEADLEDPDDRLALHVALKLRRLLQAGDRAAADRTDGGSRTRGENAGALHRVGKRTELQVRPRRVLAGGALGGKYVQSRSEARVD
jgi:PucR C-terminal helix-turn-helix domain